MLDWRTITEHVPGCVDKIEVHQLPLHVRDGLPFLVVDMTYDGDNWVVSSRVLFFTSLLPGSLSLNEAKNKAEVVILNKIHEVIKAWENVKTKLVQSVSETNEISAANAVMPYFIQYDDQPLFTMEAKSLAEVANKVRGQALRIRVWADVSNVALIDTKFGDTCNLLPNKERA